MRRLRAFCIRLFGLIRQGTGERELAEEIESHLQLHIDDNLRAGMHPEEARRAALLKFGGVESAKEAYRDRRRVRLLEELWRDLGYAVRILRKDKVFTTMAVLTLALGIGANTAIFSLIDAVLLKHLPVSHPEELWQVTMESGMSRELVSNPLWEELRDRQDVFSGLFAYDSSLRFNLSAGGESRSANGNWVSGDFFSTLGVRPVLGRLLTRSDDRRGCPGVAVLSYSFWQKEYGGSAAALEQTISLDFHRFPIAGVIEPGFFGVDVGRAADVFVPLCAEPITRGRNSYLDGRSSYPLRVVGRRKPGIDPGKMAARLRVLAPGIFASAADPEQVKYMEPFEIRPAGNGLSAPVGRNGFRDQYRAALIALMVVVGLVLVIACANVANLLLARAAVRQRELAVRLALGSGRARLFRQLLTESVLLSVSGAALGVWFVPLASRVMVRLLSSTDSAVFLDLAIDGRVLAFTVLAGIATGVFFGVAPAWRATRIQPHAAMRKGGRGAVEGVSRFGLGKALVIAQIGLSLVLLVGAGLLLGTLRRLASLDPGFQREHVLLVQVDLSNGHYPAEGRSVAYQEMLERLRGLPGVRAASYSGLTPITPFFSVNTLVAEGSTARATSALFDQVGDGYFDTLGIPILAGRDFNRYDRPGSPRVAIINQFLARKLFAETNPLGKRYRIQIDEAGTKFSEPVEIAGIARDFKFNSLREEGQPMVFVPVSQEEDPGLFNTLELRAAHSPAELIPSVKAAMAQVNPNIALEFVTLSAQVDASLTRERLLATLSSFFGGLALLLAAIGLYGVISYSVARRRNEIGIRVALGAGQGSIQHLVLGEVSMLVGAGLATGVAGALAATRLATGFLYGLKATDPGNLALACGLLAGVAGLAGYLPARRASRLDPMTALREE